MYLEGEMKKLRLPLLALIACLCFCACQPPTTKPKTVNATISGVSWATYNVDNSYWSSAPSNNQHLFYRFWIEFSGTLTASDISSAGIYPANKGYHWSFTPSSDFDSASNSLISGYYYDGDNSDALPLGTMEMRVVLADGKTLTQTIVTTPPGTSTVNASTVIRSEDVLATIGVAALSRPTALSETTSGSNLTLHFTLSDSRIHNGYIWFYDNSGNYVGRSAYFLDKDNGVANSGLNSGLGITTQGANAYTTGGSDITYASGMGFSQIRKFSVVVFDGSQYIPQGNGHYADWDHRAVSEIKAF
jgi:hypothetical protein